MVLVLVTKVVDVVGYIGSALLRFVKWFYLTLIPFVIQYIGIPMFALGILLALAFTGGTVLFIIVFCIFMFYFIRGTLLKTKPVQAIHIK